MATISNAASVIGRHICFLDDATGWQKQQAKVIAYEPESNQHTVQFLKTGREKTLVLNTQRFKFLVHKCEMADHRGRGRRRLEAANRDAVGRKLKVFSKTRNRFLHGTIKDFNSETEKHTILFQGISRPVFVDLSSDSVTWRYTDLVSSGGHSRSMSIATSKYAGVGRSSERKWIAHAKTSKGNEYIGTFGSEKDAALAHDFFARKADNRDINFPNEKVTEDFINERKSTQYDFSECAPARGVGKSKFRGVHWQKNRKRWMARYSLAQRGQKNVNLGAFENAEHAAMAFDFEARKRGRPECDLNFPNVLPSEQDIDRWRMNRTHYNMMGSGRKKSSQFRGVTFNKSCKLWTAQCNIGKVVEGMGKTKGPVCLGRFDCEKKAALVFDGVCRKFGVAEKELNFPRNHQLKEVRLFDDECYFCQMERPQDPVATSCNHVFCRKCILLSLESSDSCPCCNTPNIEKGSLRSVELINYSCKRVGTSRKRKRDEGDFGDDGPASG